MNKTAKILLAALTAFVLVGATAFAIYFVNVNAIRFDTVSQRRYSDNSYFLLPVFGNKLMLEEGGVYSSLFNLGMKNLDVYDEVNAPIQLYSVIISTKYDSVQLTDYSVINEGGKTLTVTLMGTADDGGETVPIEKVFVFDIENASLDKLPTWTNRTEEDDEVYQYLVRYQV